LKPTIAVFGEVLADVFPEQSVLGGAPFNVARHLQVFDLHPLLISRTGQDVLGEALLQEMSRLGMDTAGMQRDAGRLTGQVQVIFENGTHRFDILPDQAYDHICDAATRQTLAASRPQLAYFGTLVQRSAQSRMAAEQFLRDCECPLFLDINLRAPWYDETVLSKSLDAAHIVKLNDEELAEVASLFNLEGQGAEAQAVALQKRFDLQQILVTCGDAGSWLLDEQQQVTRVAPIKLQQPIVDTVGAGDAYAAVYMLGMLQQWSLSTTLQRASEYAAAICCIRGAAPAPAEDIQSFKQAWGLGVQTA
jgi:fructokinase